MPTRYRVLVADDYETVRVLWRDALRKPVDAYEVVTAGNGHDALEEIVRMPFDLIVTDIAMPGMDGVELTQAIRQLGHRIPVIWITASRIPNLAQEAERLAVHRYLFKPLEVDEMRQVVAAALEDPQEETI